MTEPNNKQKQADLLFFTTRTDGMGRFLSSGNDMVNVGRILQIVEDSEKEKIELEKESTP